MNYLSEIFSFMILFPAAALCLLPVRNQLRLPIRKLCLVASGLFAVLIPLCAAIVTLADLPTNYVLLPLVAVLFACYQKVLKTHICTTASVFLLVMALMSFPTLITLAIDCRVHPLEGSLSHCPLVGSVQLGISVLFLLLYAWFFYRFLGDFIDFTESPRVWAVSLPVPLIFIVLNIMMMPHKYETMYVNRVYPIYLIYIALVFFLFNIIYLIFYMMTVELRRSSQDRERIRFFEMQESHYLAQQRYITESSRQRHDFRQQLLSIAQMAQDKDYDALTSHLSEYISSLPESVTTYCLNIPVNALLNYYAARMDADGIRRSWKISLPNNLQITDTELCGLLGNLLENVYYGCQTLPPEKKYHNLTIQPQHDRCLYIISENSFDGVVKQRDDAYLSTHKGGSGIGLTSIATVAEKYGGMAKFSHTADCFTIDIVIQK